VRNVIKAALLIFSHLIRRRYLFNMQPVVFRFESKTLVETDPACWRIDSTQTLTEKWFKPMEIIQHPTNPNLAVYFI